MLDTKACILYLNCSREEYSSDYSYFCSNMIPRGYMRVFFHELTHYFQINATTNGAYLSLLEDFQIIQVRQILKAAEGIKCPVISELIRNHGPETEPRAWYHLRKWYAAELLKALFDCDFNRCNYLIQNTVFSEELISDIYTEIDEEMCRVFQKPEIRKNIGEEKRHISEDLSGIIKKGSSPYENHARMAEFWWEGKNTENPYRHKGIDLHCYSAWIEAFAERVKIDDFQNFVSSFLAVCELAQFAPVLPGLRSVKEASIYDFLPMYRMGTLVEAAGEVPPVDGINDYNRYVNALCEKAGFTGTADICREIVDGAVHPGQYFWADLFYEAMRTRNRDFSTFSYYGLWHPLALSVEPAAKGFIQEFNPPVICYSDCCFARKNSAGGTDEAFSIICRNVFRKYVSMIMTGYNVGSDGIVYIKAPVHAAELERQYIEYQVGRLIENKLHIMPNLKII